MKEKHIGLAGSEVVVRMKESWANRIAASSVYRYVLRPTLSLLTSDGRTAPTAVGEKPLRPEIVPVYFPRPIELPEATPEQKEIVERIKQCSWYHTIELGYGVRTPGEFDHGPALGHFPLPESLKGKRCLDVATFDGFWAFEMERRGADEVVALDIESWLDLDLPPYIIERFKSRGLTGPTGAGFKLAADILGSRVERRICNVYDLSPETFGEFDYVVCSDLLVHLTNPLRALQNVWSVTKGEAVLAEPYIAGSTGHGPFVFLSDALDEGRWWHFSHDFLEKAARSGGFTEVVEHSQVDLRVRYNAAIPAPQVVVRAIK